MDPVLYDIGILLVYFILLAWARYSQFKNDLRLPVKWMVLLVAAMMVAGSMLWYFLGRPVGFPWDYFRFFISLLMFAISCFVIKVQFSKHALSYIVLVSYQMVLEATASFAAEMLAPQSVHLSNIFLVALLILTLYPLNRLLQMVTEKLSGISTDRVWNYLCLCGFSFLMMNLMLTFPMTVIDVRWLLARYLLISGMIGMYAAAIWIQKGMRIAAETQAALELANRQVAMQQSYYDHLVIQMDEIRHIRHDLRHHYAALRSLIQTGDAQAAVEYLSNLPSLDSGAPVTGNLVADSLVGFYYAQAKELGFTMDVQISMPGSPPIAETDLCIILGNLLENAIDAQSYLEPADRFVRVCARSDKNSFTLAVDNRFDGFLQKDGDKFLSRKGSDSHGIGLSSVRAVCQKYSGVLQLETQGYLFLAGVAIGL